MPAVSGVRRELRDGARVRPIEILDRVIDRQRYDLDLAPCGWALFSSDRGYRYALGRSRQEGIFDEGPGRMALFCGLNPSSAGAVDDDQTITKELGFAERLGCRSLVKVNLYPLISMDPAGLEGYEALPEDDALLSALVALLVPLSCLTVAAWGSHSMATKERVAAVTAFLPGPLHCLGTTKDGSPRHPSRIAYATPLERWKGMA